MSPDGYLRMRFVDLCGLTFVHLFSSYDETLLDALHTEGVCAATAGISEWKSETDPEVSLGWDWFVDSSSGRLLPVRKGVRSNLMLLDAKGYDLGPGATACLCAAWLGVFEWQPTVAGAVRSVEVPVKSASFENTGPTL